MKVYAHRGYSAKYPENTLIAFKKAFEAGAYGIELDVRRTKDGKAIVFHDDDLKRLFGIEKRVDEMDFCELRALEIEGEKIPIFEEVLDIIPPEGHLIVEIKDRMIARKVICKLISGNFEEKTIISSFDHELIEDLMKDFPELDFAYILGEEHKDMDPQKILERILIHRPHSVHIPRDAYEIFGENILQLMDFLRENSIQIFLWNINNTEDLKIFEDHIDAVITDEVEKFLRTAS